MNRIMRLRDMVVSIWSNRKWRRSIRRPQKPHLEPNMKGMGWCVAELCHLNSPKCVNGPWGRSIGRQYSYFLHWCHILLFRYVRNVARQEQNFENVENIKQEAQLPQRNSASAAHMEGAKPSSPLPLRPLWVHLCVCSNPKPATNVRQACRP